MESEPKGTKEMGKTLTETWCGTNGAEGVDLLVTGRLTSCEKRAWFLDGETIADCFKGYTPDSKLNNPASRSWPLC
jgi:hypothetical protein